MKEPKKVLISCVSWGVTGGSINTEIMQTSYAEAPRDFVSLKQCHSLGKGHYNVERPNFSLQLPEPDGMAAAAVIKAKKPICHL